MNMTELKAELERIRRELLNKRTEGIRDFDVHLLEAAQEWNNILELKIKVLLKTLEDARVSLKCEGYGGTECQWEEDVYIPCPAHGRIDKVLKEFKEDPNGNSKQNN